MTTVVQARQSIDLYISYDCEVVEAEVCDVVREERWQSGERYSSPAETI